MAIELDFEDQPKDTQGLDFDDPVKRSLSYGATRNPDQHAKIVSLAEQRRLPVDMVERNLPEVERQVERKLEFDGTDLPVTQRALSDPDTAAMSHDDLDGLSAMERVFKRKKSFGDRLQAGVKKANVGMGVLGEVIGYSIDQATGSVGSMFLPKPRGVSEEQWQKMKPGLQVTRGGAGITLAARTFNELETDPKIQSMMEAIDAQTGTASKVGTGVSFLFQNPDILAVLLAEQASPAALAGGGLGGFLGSKVGTSIAKKIATESAQKYARRTATMAGVALTSNMVQGYGPAVAEGKQKGLSTSEALTYAGKKAGTEALVNAGFAFIPTAGGRIAQVLQEAGKQAAAGATGAAAGAAAVGEEISIGELILEAAGELTTTVVDIPTAALANRAETRAALEVKEGQKVIKGNLDQIQLDGFIETAKALKLADRSDERTKDFLNRLNQTYGDDAQVYIDGDAVAEVIGTMDADLPGVQEMKRQIDQGGDIVLPLDVYLTDIARTDTGATVRPHVRIDVDGLSQVELEQAEPQMKARIDKIMEQAGLELEQQETLDAFQEEVFQQLMATRRMSQQMARAQSLIIPAYVATRSSQYGLNVDQMIDRLGFGGVVGPGGQVAADADVVEQVESILSQRETVEAVEVKGEGDLTNVKTGSPITVWFTHNPQSFTKMAGKPKKGDRFGRDFEPSGRFISIVSQSTAQNPLPGFISGQLTFVNPLVVDQDSLQWKRKLSEQYDGKTGKELSKAVIKDGYDAIVTIEDGKYISETVDLTTFDESKALYQPAFHGTPHKFDRFSLEAIGTGQDAQAFGWGLYFASKRGVAEWYRDSLTRGDISEMSDQEMAGALFDEMLKTSDLDNAVQIDSTQMTRDEFVTAWMDEEITLLDLPVEAMDALEDREGGSLFAVDIPEDEDLIVYEAPLSQQPDNVKQALQAAGIEITEETGEDFYRRTSEQRGGDQAASEYLNSLGIPGLRYLDGTNGDSYNYVIWDENTVTIEAVNDELVQAMRQQPEAKAKPARGLFTISERTIQLLENSDPSTFIHESGHLFLEMEKQLAAEFGVTEQQRDLLNWFGVDSFDAIGVKQHEQFARGFEAYALEGKAPSNSLAAAFASFRRWLLTVYKQIARLNVTLTPEVRNFFDHMLATDAQIAEARANPAYEPFFTDIESAGMTEEEWQAYQERQQQSADRATRTLEEKILSQLRHKYTKEWKQEYNEMREQAHGELIEQDVYRVAEFIRGNLQIDDMERFKLDRDRVEEILGLRPEPTKRSKEVDPEVDSLLVAVAKLGGLDRDDAEAEGIDPDNWKGKNASTINQPVFGKRIFRKDGMSFDHVREALGQFGWNFDTVNELLDAVNAELRGDLVYSELVNYDVVFGLDEKPAKQPMPRSLWGLSEKGGVDPDQVALDFGFANGSDMLIALRDTPMIHDATKAIADDRMMRKHGDILNDGTIEQEARDAAQNEAKAKVLLTELRALNKQAGVAQDIDRQAIKDGAARTIAAAKISDIKPNRFYRAEIKAAEKAAAALAAGNIDEARSHKVQQLANHYLYREATEAMKRVTTMRRHMASIRDRKLDPKQVDPEYIQQMKLLAAAYDFGVRKKDSDEAKRGLLALANWVNAQIGDESNWIVPQFMDPILAEMNAIITSDLTREEKNQRIEAMSIPRYDEMTMEQLRGVYDMARNLRYVGGRLSKAEAEAFKALTEQTAASIIQHGGKDVQVQQESSAAERLMNMVKQFGADHVVLGNRITEMDGWTEFGPMWRAFYQQILDSTNKELALKREVHAKLTEIFSKIPRKDLHAGFRESGHAGHRQIIKQDGSKWSLSRRGRLVLAMYWGAPESREALLQGNNITETDALAMISTLTDTELDFVQAIWDLNESLWPQVRDTALKMTGVAPPKVEHVPFEVNGRKMPGGYIRLFYKYDARDTFLEEGKDAMKGTRSGGTIVKNTKHGARNERVGSGGRAVDLELDNLFRALDENIHDITFAETARDGRRFLQSKAIRNAIVTKYGREVYESLVASMNGVVAGPIPATGMVNKVMRYFRTNASYAMLGYSIRNLMQQPVALTNVFGKIGEKYTLKGMLEFYSHPLKMKAKIEEVQSKSEFMRQRTSLVNRETAEISNRINDGLLSGPLKRHAFDLQTLGDGAIAYPAWLGAYAKGLVQFGSEKKAITFADEMVAQTIGSGLMKDLSPLMQGSGINEKTGSEMLKSLTFMGSFFNKVSNLTRDAYKQNNLRTARGAAEFTRQMTWYLMAPAVVSALIVGQLPDEDDDEGWAEWASRVIAEYGLAQMFMVRDLVYLFNGFKPNSPYTRAVEQMGRGVTVVGDVVTGERPADAEFVAKMLRFGAVAVPLPGSGQVARTIEGVVDAAEGNDRNLYQMLVEGKER